MYVTRPLSLYERSPESLSLPPPEGPNSGYLVLFDEESETTTCFGLCKDDEIKGLPFPQNKNLTVDCRYASEQTERDDEEHVIFIPVLNQPLSSNRYYAINRTGKYAGKASASSKEEDMSPVCCCGSVIKDVKPRPLDPLDEYQQVEIIHKKNRGFTAKSVVPDGIPPDFLRSKYWKVSMSTPRNYQLREAPGLDPSLRKRLPEFNNISVSNETSEAVVVVGKWYCPFMFVHQEGLKLKRQMKTSMFYEITLEQRWHKIFSCDNNSTTENDQSNVVLVDVCVKKEEVYIEGILAAVVKDAQYQSSNGVTWFASTYDGRRGGGETRVGLSTLVIERMKWEEERVGWAGGNEGDRVKVERPEEYGGVGLWSKFGCFMLVERFVFKSMDGRIVLTYDFKHTHQIRCKWE